tara:strand:- start:1274 stop:1531 length:258 start_codon:yes stop_codon:yes gene_type:complete
MQKIVNAIAIASGAVSLVVVGLGGYVFIRKDAIIDNVKSKVMESVLPGGLGDLGGGALGGLDLPKFGAPAADAPTEPSLPVPMPF